MRGEIKNRDRARQLRDFTGLKFGSITPTDVDGFVEFGDKLYVWMEAKLENESLPDGQRLALERSCDAVAETGRESIVLVLDHNTSPDEDIPFASCPVRAFWYQREWHKPKQVITCRDAIVIMRHKIGLGI